MADLDFEQYIKDNPDTLGQTVDRDSLLGPEATNTVLKASSKASESFGSFIKQTQSVLNSRVFTTLKRIAGKIISNGEGSYDPSQHIFYVGDLKLEGVIECRINYPDVFKTYEGLAIGGNTVARKRNGVITMEIVLQRTSPSCAALNQAWDIMYRTGRGKLKIHIIDNGGIGLDGDAVIVKKPDNVMDIEGADLTYTFQLFR